MTPDEMLTFVTGVATGCVLTVIVFVLAVLILFKEPSE